jgi:hypothetical protein
MQEKSLPCVSGDQPMVILDAHAYWRSVNNVRFYMGTLLRLRNVLTSAPSL